MAEVFVRKYLAFDIETATDVPGDDFDMASHRPLGICCAAALLSDVEDPILWHGTEADGAPAPRLTRTEASRVVHELMRFVSEGYTLLTWNGLGFDLDVLAEESGELYECKALAMNHVDMMFHVFCNRGFPVAIDKAAQGLGIPGKTPGMSGKMAPKMWSDGRYAEVLGYVSQDVRMTLNVAVTCEKARRFQWLTRRGTTQSFPLDTGWLTVHSALELPAPDTGWMTDPMPRSRFTQWLESP
jgi:hypothetical protein